MSSTSNLNLRTRIGSLLTAVLATAHSLALPQGFEKINTTVTNVNAILITISIAVVTGDGNDFGVPTMVGGQIRSVVAWSRLFLDQEWLCAINTDASGSRAAWVNVDAGLSPPGSRFVCHYASDPARVGTMLSVKSIAGRSAVWLDLPAGGCVVCGPG